MKPERSVVVLNNMPSTNDLWMLDWPISSTKASYLARTPISAAVKPGLSSPDMFT